VHSLNDERLLRGDGTHAPPEYHYNFTPPDWDERHLATDLYLLGSLVFSFYMGVSMTLAIMVRLPPELLPMRYGGTFPDLLPALQHAFGGVLDDFAKTVPASLRDVMVPTIRLLCHPDPSQRGHPKSHKMVHGNKFSVERFISIFNRMAVIAEGEVGK
jgi:hypothetical protein